MILTKHWMVYRRNGRLPRHRHSSREAAGREALRLAGQNPAAVFLVLEAVEAYGTAPEGTAGPLGLLPADPPMPEGPGWRRHDGTVPAAPLVDVVLRHGGLLHAQATETLDWGIGPGPTDIFHVREIYVVGVRAKD